MHVDEENRVDVRTNDPPTTTPYATVASFGPLRLRRYLPPDGAPQAAAPVLMVYPLVKRPYILDLISGRSVVRTLQAQGLSVYVTDWAPPGPQDTSLGFDEYINTFLVAAINEIRQREGVPRVALIGCCCGAVLSSIYAALHPFDVERLMTFATPIAGRTPIDSATAELLRRLHGNIPAWVLRPMLNARVPTRFHLAALLARDLGEAELAQIDFSEPPPLLLALERWLGSDVPVAGQVFVEMVREVLGERRLAENRLRVGGVRVDLGRIQCPLLSLSGVRDEVVTPRCGALLAEQVGSAETRHWMFPSGHLGLMIGNYAHRELWPRVGEWLLGRASSIERPQFVKEQSKLAP